MYSNLLMYICYEVNPGQFNPISKMVTESAASKYSKLIFLLKEPILNTNEMLSPLRIVDCNAKECHKLCDRLFFTPFCHFIGGHHTWHQRPLRKGFVSFYWNSRLRQKMSQKQEREKDLIKPYAWEFRVQLLKSHKSLVISNLKYLTKWLRYQQKLLLHLTSLIFQLF